VSDRRILDAVDALRDDLVAFTQALVRVPTVNPPGQRYEECARLVAATLERLGYEVREVRPQDDPDPAHPRVNVVGRLRGATQRPLLHFNGHFDVVPPGDPGAWTHDPFGGEVAGGRIWGRGTGDQKAGIAASVYAIEAIRRAGLRLAGTVEQSATVDEESGGFAGVAELCAQGICTATDTDHVVITEPLDVDRVCLGHRGVLWTEVTARGLAAHGSMPGLGRSAADAIARLVARVDTELRPRLEERTTAMPVAPPEARRATINVNALHAGQAVEVEQTPMVADIATAIFDRRFLVEERLADVRAELGALMDRERARDDGIEWSSRERMVVEPVFTDATAPVARAFAGAIREVVGRDATFIASPGTYDQKHVVRIGGVRDCIAYGPGRLVTAHRPDEYVVIDELVDATKVMALAALRLLGTA
jgi:succinyl-diaminopimelate desuccinylase